MLDKIMVGVGLLVTMDTVQIMTFLVTLVLTYERTILHTTTDFFYFSYELFLCITILNSVMEHSTVLYNIIIVTLLIVYTQYYHIWYTS